LPTRKYSRLGRVRGSAHPILLIFSLVALPPPRAASGRAPSPLPPPEVVDTVLISVTKRKNHPIGWFSFVLYRLNRCHPKKVNKIKGFRYLSRFLSASLIDANLNFNKIWLKFSTKGVDKTN